MKKALITFVKAPVPGNVKTRLQADLGAEQTVEIYKSFIGEILTQCSRLKGIDRFLGCAPTTDHVFLKQMSEKYKLKVFNQRGNNLGKKIINAFQDHFRKGYTDIVLIGSDSPTIPKEYIRKAFNLLKKNEIIIGPCCDGGIYLIGAKTRIEPGIFKNIPWDTSQVLNLVLENLFKFKIQFAMLPFWYDVDDVDDYTFFKLHLQYLNRK